MFTTTNMTAHERALFADGARQLKAGKLGKKQSDYKVVSVNAPGLLEPGVVNRHGVLLRKERGVEVDRESRPYEFTRRGHEAQPKGRKPRPPGAKRAPYEGRRVVSTMPHQRAEPARLHMATFGNKATCDVISGAMQKDQPVMQFFHGVQSMMHDLADKSLMAENCLMRPNELMSALFALTSYARIRASRIAKVEWGLANKYGPYDKFKVPVWYRHGRGSYLTPLQVEILLTFIIAACAMPGLRLADVEVYCEGDNGDVRESQPALWLDLNHLQKYVGRAKWYECTEVRSDLKVGLDDNGAFRFSQRLKDLFDIFWTEVCPRYHLVPDSIHAEPIWKEIPRSSTLNGSNGEATNSDDTSKRNIIKKTPFYQAFAGNYAQPLKATGMEKFVTAYTSGENAVHNPLIAGPYTCTEAVGMGTYVQLEDQPETTYVVVNMTDSETWEGCLTMGGNLVTFGTEGLITHNDTGTRMDLALAPLSYGNLITFSAGDYPTGGYFRVRMSPNGLPFSSYLPTFTGIEPYVWQGAQEPVYYTSGNRSMGVGRLLFYFINATVGYTAGVPNCSMWFSLTNTDDWIVSTDLSVIAIDGFVKIDPSLTFWSQLINSDVRAMWDIFIDTTSPLDVFNTRVGADGVCLLSNNQQRRYFFFNTGTVPAGDPAVFSSVSTYWMFHRWLTQLHALTSIIPPDISISGEDQPGCWYWKCEDLSAAKNNHTVCSTLNGNNGEATNSDDTPGGEGGKKHPPKNKGSKNNNGGGKKNKGGKKKGGGKDVGVLQRGLVKLNVGKKTKNSIPHTIKLTRCARTFLSACVDPFGCTGQDVFLPIGAATNTQRSRGFARILVTTGTQGVGFIGVVPTVANDRNCVWYTTASFAGTSFVPFSDVATPALTTGVLAMALGNLPYNAAEIFSATVNGESYANQVMDCACVAWGVQVVNSSQEVNLGGTITAYSSPARCSMYGATQANLGSYLDAQVVVGTRQAVTLSMYPTESIEMEFSPEVRSKNMTGTPPLDPYWPMCSDVATPACTSTSFPAISNVIMFTGVPGSQYLCHIAGFNEYFGLQTQGQNRQKVVDPVGVAKVMDVMGRARIMCQEQGKTLKSCVARAEAQIARDLHET